MPESPLEWREHLDSKLVQRLPRVRRYEAYHDGRHPLAFATAEFREEFGRILDDYSDNWCRLIVDAPMERLRVVGFRFGSADEEVTQAEGGVPPSGEVDTADERTWQIWRANRLKLRHREAIRTSLTTSISYGMAWFPPEGGDIPRVSFEHPDSFMAVFDPADPGVCLAAMKRWVDLDGHGAASVITPEWVARLRTASVVQGREWSGWQVQEQEDNPLSLVPVVELANRADLRHQPFSEIADVIPNQDAINKMAVDMLVASEYGGFVQKTGTGVEIEVDPETNQPVAEFKPNKKRFLHTENEGGRFGSIPHTPLSNFVDGLENRVNSVASQTRTPPHYLNARAGDLSGESIKAAEAGLVSKVREKQEALADGFEQLMRYAHLARGDEERYQVIDAETLWQDPESRTEAEHTDAIIKQYQAGLISWQVAVEKLDYSPTEIRRMRGQVRQERLEQAATSLDDLGETV